MTSRAHQDHVVLTGTYQWSGVAECDVKVVLSPVRYGTGDYDDPPDVAEDAEIPTYYLWWGSTTERGVFNAGGGAFASLEEAVAHAEAAPGVGHTVKWHQGETSGLQPNHDPA